MPPAAREEGTVDEDWLDRTSSVSTRIDMDVTEPATLVLQVAVAGDPQHLDERLDVTVDGDPVRVEVLAAPAGGRQHLVRAPEGRLEVRYRALVPADHRSDTGPVTDVERVEALRPSRYAPSDRVPGLAGAELAVTGTALERVQSVCDGVARRTAYTPGASGPTTDAVDTLLGGQGVCRDYAHVVAMLCRAAGVPARVASVYAPGLSPMDMHAVVEAEVDGRWTVWDATRLAPRPTMLRVATGRDAADTAFSTVLAGRAELTALEVLATAPGDLPWDDHRDAVVLGA